MTRRAISTLLAGLLALACATAGAGAAAEAFAAGAPAGQTAHGAVLDELQRITTGALRPRLESRRARDDDRDGVEGPPGLPTPLLGHASRGWHPRWWAAVPGGVRSAAPRVAALRRSAWVAERGPGGRDPISSRTSRGPPPPNVFG